MSVLGLCNLLSMLESNRPSEVTEVGSQILPAALVLFNGLKRAYESKCIVLFVDTLTFIIQ